MGCFLERLGVKPSFSRDLAKGETAATEVQRRWNAEGARNAPIAKSLGKPGLETSECKEACHSVNGYPNWSVRPPPANLTVVQNNAQYVLILQQSHSGGDIFRSRVIGTGYQHYRVHVRGKN